MTNNQLTGIIFNIQRFTINDGPGIRTTVFFKGCHLRCWWCHNPESHKILPEKIEGCNIRRGFNQSFSMDEDEIGKEISVEQLMNEIVKDKIFFEESDGGVTFSGGEPLMQPEFLTELLKECNSTGIHSAVDTSGYADTEIINQVAPYSDLFLFDLKLMNDDDHQKYTGVSNQAILRNLSELDQMGKKIIARIPIVPGVTDSDDNLYAIRGFISYLNNLIEVNLLPYHRAGEGKYKKYGKDNKMTDTQSPDLNRLEEVKQLFSELKCRVKIGG